MLTLTLTFVVRLYSEDRIIFSSQNTMSFISHDSLICPIDGLALLFEKDALSCTHGHQFDIGKPGYANLLAVQHKRSKSPGDSKPMVNARTAFLAKDFYAPIARRLAGHIADHVRDSECEQLTIVDAGCGEGYYLEQISALVEHDLHLVGFDISKWAIQRAARRCTGTWLVASNKRIPLADNSVDFMLDLFGFPDFESFRRVLKPNGKLLRATPSTNHLIEVRNIIYPALKDTRPRQQPDSFKKNAQFNINYELALVAEDIHNLLAMTPHLYRAPREGLTRLAEFNALNVTVDVNVDVLELS